MCVCVTDSEVMRAETEQKRVQIYNLLSHHLPASCKEYFDNFRDTDIAFGVGLGGRAEQLINKCVRYALALGMSLA